MRSSRSFEIWSQTTRLRRFDVNEDISDARVALLNGALDLVRNPMAVANGNATVDADMKIGIKTEAHFADETFFNLDNTGHGAGRIPDKIDNFSARRRVHNFVQGRFQ